jgi:hypothetical protein
MMRHKKELEIHVDKLDQSPKKLVSSRKSQTIVIQE